MDAMEILGARHAELEDLFHEISCTRDGETRRMIFEDIATKIASHGDLVMNGPWSRSGTAAARTRIASLVAELQSQSADGRAWGVSLQSLQEEMEQLMDELETPLVPRLGGFPRANEAQVAAAA